uniref:Ribosome production factor 2 homolog n=1 Tax=Globodera rostochiensis TaxID=31243 RepID=A0A914ICF4_GLORO
MRVEKVKTRRGKKFLEDRAPKLIENDKTAFFVKGNKCSEVLNKMLGELYHLRKPLANRLQRNNDIHPFEDDSLLCRFSYKFDASLFVFGSSTKKRPTSLVFGRMYDHQMLDMVEMRVEKFVSSDEFKTEGVTLGVKPCIILQGHLFESNGTLQRVGNLMGIELVISLTAISEERINFRVYRAVLKKSMESSTPKVDLVEMGPNIDFKIDRLKLASDSLFKTALKKPQDVQKGPKKNVKFDAFGNKVAQVHTGRQRTDTIQTRKVKALKRSANVKRFDNETDVEMDEG